VLQDAMNRTGLTHTHWTISARHPTEKGRRHYTKTLNVPEE
jgi:hypothetical protein